MKKLLAVAYVIVLIMNIGIVSAEQVVILNNSIAANPVIHVKNLSAYTQSNVNISVNSSQIKISGESNIIAYTQKPQAMISVNGNLTTSGVQAIPIQANISSVNTLVPIQVPLQSNILYSSGNNTSVSQSIDLNLSGSQVIVSNQNLIVQTTDLNNTYKINNINITNSSASLVVNTQLILNKTDQHNISITIGNGSNNLVLNSNGVIVNTNLTLKFDSAGIYAQTRTGNVEILNLPETVAEIAGNNSKKNIELKIVQEEPVYIIKETKDGKILGLFPASMDVEIQVNSNNSETKTIKEPWWSVFFVE